MKDRIYGLDFLKAIAAFFITNSHFQPLYQGVSTKLATMGVQGNALFFFVSGYLLLAGLDMRHERFDNWYKRKIRRLMPAILTFWLCASIIFGDVLTWQKMLLVSGYWFIQCILAYFIIFYFVCKLMLTKNKLGGVIFILSILASIAYFFYLPHADGSVFHTNLHYVCHFSVMVMGSLVYLHRKSIKCTSLWKDLVAVVLSFVFYFLIMAIGKGRSGMLYYTQILGLLPLHTFVYYLYKVSCYNWCDRLFHKRGIRWIFIVPASLTLEIYIVQFHVITNKLNFLFPLNLLIIFFIICVAAYILHVCTSFVLQVINKENFNWGNLLKLI